MVKILSKRKKKKKMIKSIIVIFAIGLAVNAIPAQNQKDLHQPSRASLLHHQQKQTLSEP